jgi:hypothetical protein
MIHGEEKKDPVIHGREEEKNEDPIIHGEEKKGVPLYTGREKIQPEYLEVFWAGKKSSLCNQGEKERSPV